MSAFLSVRASPEPPMPPPTTRRIFASASLPGMGTVAPQAERARPSTAASSRAHSSTHCVLIQPLDLPFPHDEST